MKKSFNKNKTIGDIVNLETNKTDNTEGIDNLYLDGNTISDCQEMANAFNKYFLKVKVLSLNKISLVPITKKHHSSSLFNAVFQESFSKY